ncbi:MAG: hypothetical protein J6P02_04310 [Lachnospiraceae bacterium]|nr:hypothetical protein [Lachnospiraceae bacterium]
MVTKTISKSKKSNERINTVSRKKKIENEGEHIIEPLENGESFSKKPIDPKSSLIIGIIAVIIVAVVVAFLVLKKNIMPHSNTETIVSKNELKDKLNVDIKEPDGSSDIVYGIENSSIAKISYKKKVSDGTEMNFIMRTSFSTEEIENSIGVDVEFAYTPIMMTVVCDDGSEIPVESKVALDSETEEMRYMKALWYDNDKYYSMVTDNLVTREDFLQEVNRVIIANHEEF